MRRYFSSLQTKLLAFCLILSVVISFIISIQIFRSLNETFEKSQIQNSYHHLSLAAENVERDLTILYQTVLFCSTNTDINRFMSASTERAYTTYPVSMTAYEQLRVKVFNSPIESYVEKLILCSQRHEYLIQGKGYGLNTDVTLCMAQPWFQPLLENGDYKWIGLVEEPFASSARGARSIPVVRPVINNNTGEYIGWIYIGLNPAIVLDKVNTDHTYLFWIMEDHAYQYHDGQFSECSVEVDYQDDVLASIQTEDGPMTAVYAQTGNAPWLFLQTLPTSDGFFSLAAFIKDFLPYIALLFISVLGFSLLLKRIVSDPAKRLCRQLEKVAEGDFSTNATLETADEFGYIGKGINSMSTNISKLIAQLLTTEEEKRRLELDSLQNQISPHFLYNTLYTIKLMAVMQNVPSIAEMLDSLSLIMKNISKSTDTKTTLRDELALLKHYITIQKYRYGNNFSYEQLIHDDALLDCMVFKFTLQPIIENAIFHGISAKNSVGEIHLDVFQDGQDLLISITDNGVGIQPQQVASILSTQPSPEKSEDGHFKKIGLRNINTRMKLEYGDGYGLAIHSEPNCYTTIILRYPLNHSIAL